MYKSKQLRLTIIILLICLAPLAKNNNLLTAIQIMIFILSLYIRPDRRIIKLSHLLLVPVIIGTMNGLFRNAFYDVFKDMYYFLNPVLYLLLGSIIARRYDRMDSLRAIALLGSVCA